MKTAEEMFGEVFPWERQEDESDKAFDYFRTYLRLDKPRRITKVAEITGRKLDTLYGHSMRNNWRERARLYDTWTDRQYVSNTQEALATFRIEVIKDEVEDYQRLRDMWNVILEKFEETLSDDELFTLDKAEKAIGMLDELRKAVNVRDSLDVIARRAAGLPKTYADKDQPPPNKQEEEDVFQLDMGTTQVLEDGTKEYEL